ncbi:unnamed protein product [Toxocara canis]|uniref:Transmembrane protein n=1 Tax=Toxocara canis TaxID=6265 RepID=A0A183UAA6_TOXCA|nr:unnamed protein product [Toxocara canis]
MMGGRPFSFILLTLIGIAYVHGSDSQFDNPSWYPDYEIIIILALVGGLILVIAFIILYLTRPPIEVERMEGSTEVPAVTAPHLQPLLSRTKEPAALCQRANSSKSKRDNSDNIPMDKTQWDDDETIRVRKKPIEAVGGNFVATPSTGTQLCRDKLQKPLKIAPNNAAAEDTAAAIEKTSSAKVIAKKKVDEAKMTERESTSTSGRMRTEGDETESEGADSGESERSKSEINRSETGSNDTSASNGKRASSRTSFDSRKSHDLEASGWGWVRSPGSAIANRQLQGTTQGFQFPPWMNAEGAQRAAMIDNTAGLPPPYVPPPVFVPYPPSLASPQPVTPQVLSPTGQPPLVPVSYPPMAPPPMAPVFSPTQLPTPPYPGVPLGWTSSRATQPTQPSPPSDSEEPSSEAITDPAAPLDPP